MDRPYNPLAFSDHTTNYSHSKHMYCPNNEPHGPRDKGHLTTTIAVNLPISGHKSSMVVTLLVHSSLSLRKLAGDNDPRLRQQTDNDQIVPLSKQRLRYLGSGIDNDQSRCFILREMLRHLSIMCHYRNHTYQAIKYATTYIQAIWYATTYQLNTA